MTENDLVSRWGNERSMYFSWAEFIQNEITNKLSNFEYLIKIPVTPRLKADQSLIDKALYRRKGYANPYLDMTDKVGLRFVTLLTAHIKKIESIIAESENWLYSKDKDFEREREDNPFEFAYQSIHYVLRPKCDFMHGDMFISHEVSCEVQIRTLLQHAHAELTHDNLYKPNFSAKPQSQRLAAKSMALIEVADDFFEQVVHASGESYQNQSKLMDQLSRLYLKETENSRKSPRQINCWLILLMPSLMWKTMSILKRLYFRRGLYSNVLPADMMLDTYIDNHRSFLFITSPL